MGMQCHADTKKVHSTVSSKDIVEKSGIASVFHFASGDETTSQIKTALG